MDRISNLDCFSPVSHIHLKSVMSQPRTSIAGAPQDIQNCECSEYFTGAQNLVDKWGATKLET